MRVFDLGELRKLKKRSEEPENGQVTIIGGSDLFHGAPILALKTAARIVDMVFFSSPQPSVGRIAELLKSRLGSFIWVPWEEVDAYIEKSDAILIGPGMKRWHKESEKFRGQNSKLLDHAGTETKFVTEKLLGQFSQKKWVIDGGALQVMDEKLIPEGAILTPNVKEFKMLFNLKIKRSLAFQAENEKVKTTTKILKLIREKAKEYKCTIVYKAPRTIVCSPDECVEVPGGNPGLTKGGTGDVLAGLTVALFAQNPALLAGAGASWVVKKAADNLFEKVGTVYNSDDLAEEVPKVLGKYL